MKKKDLTISEERANMNEMQDTLMKCEDFFKRNSQKKIIKHDIFKMWPVVRENQRIARQYLGR
jgi:hypothetical protein